MEENPMKRVIAIAAVLSFVVATTASARPLSEIRASALQTHVDASNVAAPRVVIPVHVVYGTGFESPEFVPGNVETGVGQEHWSSSFTNNSWSVISPLHPDTGAQHMRLKHNTDIVPPTAGTYLAKHGGAQNGVDVLLPGPDLTGAHSVESRIAPYVGQVGLNGNGNGYSLTAGHMFANGSTFFEARMFMYDHDLDYDYDYDDIAVLTDPTCSGAPAFDVASATQWGDGGLPGFYHTYRIDMDSAAPCGVSGEPTDIGVTATQVKYYRDNVLVYSGNFPFGATVTPIKTGNTVGGTRFVSAATGFGETGDFDDMSISPEPGSLALLGLGALALIRRRR